MIDEGGADSRAVEAWTPRNPAAERAVEKALRMQQAVTEPLDPPARISGERRTRVTEASRELAAFAIECARAALTDPLTGLPNARALELDLIHYGIHGFIEQKSALAADSIEGEAVEPQELAEERRRNNGSALSVIYIDFDNFKKANDELGHDLMDQLMKEVAVYMAGLFRNEDTLYRVGGDEFVCLLLSGASREDFDERLNDFVELLKARYPYLRQIGFGVSKGVIDFDPRIHTTFKQLKRSAELAMYEEKKSKRRKRDSK